MRRETGTRRRMMREETRRLVLDAAYALFEEKGFKETTMRELAARAGVGLGTIFSHFPDKAALLVEAFERDVGPVVATGLATLPASDIRAQLLHLAGALYAFYARRPRLSLVIAGQVYQTEGEAAARLRDQVTDFIGLIAGLFAQARDRGEIGPGTDCHDAALAFWGYYLMCLSFGLWSPEPDLPAQVGRLDRLLRQLLQGIAA